MPACCEDFPGKAQQVRNVGKQSGMTADSLQDPRVFILHFALNAAMTEGVVNLGGRYRRTGTLGWIETGSRQLKRPENFFRNPGRQIAAGENFNRLSQQNEAGVGVFCAFSRAVRLSGKSRQARSNAVGVVTVR